MTDSMGSLVDRGLPRCITRDADGRMGFLPEELTKLGATITALAGTARFRAAIEDLLAFAVFLAERENEPAAARTLVGFTLSLVQSVVNLDQAHAGLAERARKASERIAESQGRTRASRLPSPPGSGVKLRKG